MKLLVDMQQMSTAAERMLTLCTEMRQHMDAVKTLLLSMDGEWQGDAAKQYGDCALLINSMYHDLECFMENFTNLLEIFATEYEDFEKEVIRKINLA